jgi:hypothetical protein
LSDGQWRDLWIVNALACDGSKRGCSTGSGTRYMTPVPDLGIIRMSIGARRCRQQSFGSAAR